MLAKRALLICMEAVVIVGVVGCGAPKFYSTEGGVYQNRKLYAVSGKDVDAVYAAALQAMDKLQLQVADKAKDVFAAKVTAKSADAKLVIVKIKPTADKKTEYSIQVGTFGDEERSRRIFTEIETALTGPKK